MSATLRIEQTDHGRQVILDCPHGTTYSDLVLPPGDEPSAELQDLMVALAIERHAQEEGCGCVRRIRPTEGQPA